MAGQNKKIAIIIPAYNEESVIKKVIDDLNKILENERKYIYKVIVVNDGSTDSTEVEIKKTNAYLISHILNSGAGSATATGLSYAQHNNFDYAVTLDADGQHLAKDVIRGLDKIIDSNIDLLIGSRLLDSTGMSVTKKIGNTGLSMITFLLFGINVTDSQSGLRLFSKKALNSLKWRTSGYEFCSEMLWRAKQKNLKIEEYPIKAVYTEYSINKGQNNWNAINIVKSLIKRRLMEIFE